MKKEALPVNVDHRKLSGRTPNGGFAKKMILGMRDWTAYLIIVCFLICTNLCTLFLLCLRFTTSTQADRELLSDVRRSAGDKLILAECEMDGATKLTHTWDHDDIELR